MTNTPHQYVVVNETTKTAYVSFVYCAKPAARDGAERRRKLMSRDVVDIRLVKPDDMAGLLNSLADEVDRITYVGRRSREI